MAATIALKKWLENGKISLEKRLQMAEKLYHMEIISIPNKSQIIFSWMCNVIVHQKRNDSQTNELLWFTAKQIFQKKIISKFKISFSSSFIKGLITILDSSNKSLNEVSCVVDCISTILENPLIAPAFLRNFDSFIAMFVTVVQKLTSTRSDCNKELIHLFSLLIDHLSSIQKQNINQQQVLEIILEQVFDPYICLLNEVNEYSNNTHEGLNDSVNHLTQILHNIFFHRNFIIKFEYLLGNLFTGNAVCPEDFNMFLTILTSSNQEKEANNLKERLKFMFQGFMNKAKQKEKGFELFIFLLKLININILENSPVNTLDIITIKEIKLSKSHQLKILHDLLCICLPFNNELIQRGPNDEIHPPICLENLLKIIYGKFAKRKNSLWFNTLNVLLNLSVELITSQIEATWMNVFMNPPDIDNKDAVLAQADLLLNIFEVFAKLHSLPNLIRALCDVTKGLTDEDQLSIDITWPSSVLSRFSVYCEEISTAQFLSIWEILITELNMIHNSSEEDTFLTKGRRIAINIYIPLLSNMLLHSCIIEQSVPEHHLNMMMKNTALEIHKLVTSFIINWTDEIVSSHILTLCYAWGELSLLLQQYIKSNMFLASTDNIDDPPLDLSYLHVYFSHKECKNLKKIIWKKDNVKLNYLLILLEIQALKVAVKNSQQAVGNQCLVNEKSINFFTALQNMSSCIIDSGLMQLKDFQMIYSKSDERLLVWLCILENFHLLSSLWPQETLTDVVKLIIDILHKPSSIICSETKMNVLGNKVLTENKFFQSTCVYVLLEKLKQLILYDESEAVASLFNSLTNCFENWVSEANTTPSNEMTEIWGNIKDGGIYFNQMCSQSITNAQYDETHLEDILRYLQLYPVILPLQYLLPGNQTRCLFCIFIALHEVGRANSPMKIKISMVCYELLNYILDGRRSVWFLEFIESSNLLSWFLSNAVQNLKWLQLTTLQKEYNALFKTTFTKLFRFVSNNGKSFVEIDTFATNISKSLDSVNSIEERKIVLTVFISTLQILNQIVQRPQIKAHVNGVCQNYFKVLAHSSLQLLNDHCFHSDLPPKLNSLLLSCYGLITKTCLSSPTPYKQKWEKILPQALLYAEKLAFSCLELKKNLEEEEDVLLDILSFYNSIIVNSKNFTNNEISIELFLRSFCIVKLAVEKFHSENNLLKSPEEIIKEDWMSLVKIITNNIFMKCNKKELNSIFLQVLNIQDIIRVSKLEIPKFHSLLECCCLIPVERLSEDKQKMIMITNYLNGLIAFCVTELSKADITDTLCLKYIVLPSINTINHFLNNGKAAISSDSVFLCCQIFSMIESFGSIDDNELFAKLMTLMYDILNALVINFDSIINTNIPAFVLGINGFLHALAEKSHRSCLKQDEDIFFLLTASQNLNRLLSLLSNKREDMQRVAPYIISEYIYILQKITVIPIIKETLITGLYSMLDVCDDHARNLLHSNIPLDQKELFKYILFNYEKHCKSSKKTFKNF